MKELQELAFLETKSLLNYGNDFASNGVSMASKLFENILKENNPYQFVGIETGVEGNSVRADFLSRAGKDSPVPGAISRTPITRTNIAPEANATGEDSAKMNNLVNTAMVNAKRNPKAYGTYNPKTVDFTFGPAGTTLATPDASQSPAQIPTLKTK